jgi:hypothetical protein
MEICWKCGNINIIKAAVIISIQALLPSFNICHLMAKSRVDCNTGQTLLPPPVIKMNEIMHV